MKLARIVRGNYIQGQFVSVSDPNGSVLSRNPGNLDGPSINYPFSFEHIQESVLVSKTAFNSWKRTTPQDRLNAIVKYRKLLDTKQEELAQFVSFETGKPLWESKLEIKETLSLLDNFTSLGSGETSFQIEVPNASSKCNGVVRFKPHGVIAIIGTANLPVRPIHAEFIPALLNGNTVVLKIPSEIPATGQFMAELFHDSGLPAGVINVIQGDTEVSRRLVNHSDVNGVFLSGSYESTAKLQKVLSDYWKITMLEIRGKNGMVIWDDCNYKRALHDCLYSSFITTGQRTTTCDRILIHKNLFNRFLDDFHTLAKKCKVGYGLSPKEDESFMGPLISEEALEQYLRHQGIAVREGCEEIMRGKILERPLKGYYASPSIHLVTKPDPKSIYQKTEVLGPNVGLYSISDLDEASEILNQTQYGMVASIYTKERINYLRLVEEVNVGLLHWNRPTVEVSYLLPYGGVKKSGNLRPMGSFASRQLTYPISSLESSELDSHFQLPQNMPMMKD